MSTKLANFLTVNGAVAYVNPARVAYLLHWPLTNPVTREQNICTLISFGGPEDNDITVQGHVESIARVLGELV
jgi:hypothetical protein